MSLMSFAIAHAQNTGLTRLEIRVSTYNSEAVALYRKVGFVCEGIAQNAAVVRGQAINKFYMALLLP